MDFHEACYVRVGLRRSPQRRTASPQALGTGVSVYFSDVFHHREGSTYGGGGFRWPNANCSIRMAAYGHPPFTAWRPENKRSLSPL